MRPNCKKCNIPLTGEVTDNITTCPKCGKRWELTADRTAIVVKKAILVVHDADIMLTNNFIGGDSNG